jgi:ribosomal protein S18 acetylase RimI-like enzyme
MSWPGGLVVRPLVASDDADIEGALHVMVEHEREFCFEPDVTRTILVAQLTGPAALADRHLVVTRGGAYVGVLIVEFDLAKRDVFFDVYALPGEDPGTTRALVEAGLAIAADVVPSEPGWTVSSGCAKEDIALSRALAAVSFEHTRTYARMVRSLAGVSATMPPAPHGIRLEIARSPEQLGQLHRTHMSSFDGHYGFTERTEADYLHRLATADGPTPERWWLAMAADHAVGLCIQDDSRAEFSTAWVRTLGVVSTHRGQGIARWLLLSACADAVDRGMSEIGLYVDTENVTGATRLYESVGMRAHLSIALWEKPAS